MTTKKASKTRQKATASTRAMNRLSDVGEPTLAKSIRSLAAYCDKSPSAVRKWIAADDWMFSQQPPWDVQKVQAWYEIHRRGDAGAAWRQKADAVERGVGEFRNIGPLTKARIQATIERALYVRQKRLTEAGKLHDVEACEGRRLRQIHAVKSALLALPRNVAQSLVGLERDAIEERLLARVEAVLEELASGG